MKLNQSTTRLGDLITLFGGGTPSKDIPSYWDGNIPWASVKDLKGSILNKTIDSISKLGLNNSSSKMVPSGNIVIATRMAVGKAVMTEVDIAINQDLKAIICSNKLNKKFLYYFLLSQQAYFNNVSTGATVKGIKINHITDIMIPDIPLHEQKKIADILDTADSLRQKDQQLIEYYNTLRQSLFLNMFGDPISNPMKWEVKKLSDFINSLNTGVSVNSTSDKYTSDQKGILKTSCVYSGVFRPQEAKVIRGDELGRMRLNPESDSIIVSRMNTTELVGKSAYIGKDYPLLYLPDRLWQSQKSELEHSVRWLAMALSLPSFMSEISKISSGTSGSMKNISKKKFLSIPIIYPTPKLQSEFDNSIQIIESQKQLIQASLKKSEDLFNSLLQRAYKGELTS